MKVALVCGEFPPAYGGVGNHVNSLAHHLHRRDFEVHVMQAEYRGVSRYVPEGPNFIDCAGSKGPVGPENVEKFSKHAAATVEDFGPFDVVHLHHPWMLLDEKSVEKIPYPKLVSVHFTWTGLHKAFTRTNDDQRTGDDRKWEKNVHKLSAREGPALNLVDRVLCPSAAVVEEVKGLGVSEEKITFYPFGVDLKEFGPANHRPDHFTGLYGLTREDPSIISVGRHNSAKGQHTIIEAFRALDHDRAHLIIVGEGPNTPSLRKRAKDIERVHFTGPIDQDELVYHIPTSWVLATGSFYEGGGQNALEALASGTLVVATKTGDHENIVGAQVISPGDTIAMTDALRTIIEMDPEERRKTGVEAKDYINRYYSTDQFILNITAEYRGMKTS